MPSPLCNGAGAIWELHELAGKAKGQRANCLLLDAFLQDVMRALDNHGAALAQTDQLRLANLLELMEAAIDLVSTCAKPGRALVPIIGLSWVSAIPQCRGL